MYKKYFCFKLNWIGVTWNSKKKAVFNTGETWNKFSPQNKSSRKEIAGKRLEPPTRKINGITWSKGKNQMQMIPVSIQY